MRTMTAREYARLQGVPDEYSIHAPENRALTAFGDAVCVPVIRWIAHYALTPLMMAHPPTPTTYSLFEDDGG